VQQELMCKREKEGKEEKAPRRRLESAKSVNGKKGRWEKEEEEESADASTKKVPRQIGLAHGVAPKMPSSLLVVLAWRHRKQQIRWVRGVWRRQSAGAKLPPGLL
jgi:hypothetical protein